MYMSHVSKKKVPIQSDQDLFKNNTIKLIEYLKSIKKKNIDSWCFLFK